MRTTAAVAFATLMVTGCGYDRGSGTDYPPAGLASIVVALSSNDPMESTGDTQLATAVARDANHQMIPTPSLTWSTSAPQVATITPNGETATITAVSDGSAIITAVSGNVHGTATVTVVRKIVSIVLAAAENTVTEGLTTQLTTFGRDARANEIAVLTDVTYTTSNAFSVRVSPTGVVSALFSTSRPSGAVITASVVRDGVTLSDTERIEVRSAAPAVFDFGSLLTPEGVRPEPLFGLAQAGAFFTLAGARVNYTFAWSLLTRPPLGAHIHGPETTDTEIADILVDLPLGNGAGINGLFTGSFSAADIRSQGGKPPIALDSLLTLMRRFSAYVDVHTAANPDGEVRGLVFRRP